MDRDHTQSGMFTPERPKATKADDASAVSFSLVTFFPSNWGKGIATNPDPPHLPPRAVLAHGLAVPALRQLPLAHHPLAGAARPGRERRAGRGAVPRPVPRAAVLRLSHQLQEVRCPLLIRVARPSLIPVSPLLNRSSPKSRRASPIEPRIRVYAD